MVTPVPLCRGFSGSIPRVKHLIMGKSGQFFSSPAASVVIPVPLCRGFSGSIPRVKHLIMGKSGQFFFNFSLRVVAVKIQISTFLNPLYLHRFSPFFLSCLFDIFIYLPPPSFRAEFGAIIVNFQKLKFSPNFKFLIHLLINLSQLNCSFSI